MENRKFYLICFFVCILFTSSSFSQVKGIANTQAIAVIWQNTQPKGTIEVVNGQLQKLKIVNGKGRVTGNSFEFNSKGDARLEVTLSNIKNDPGSEATRLTIRSEQNPFTCFLRDVNMDYPIYMPKYQAIVTAGDDLRSFGEVERVLKNRNLKTKLQLIADEPEESFESASVQTRNQPCPTWLGISRDIRIFQLSDNRTNPASEMNLITPRNSSSPVKLPELENRPAEYAYMVGRGQGVAVSTTRRLEEGVLPILHTTLIDEDIEYQSTTFVSLEKSYLTSETNLGTDFRVADQFSGGHMLTKEQEELVKPRLEAEKNKPESTVLYFRSVATNNSKVPRYAWFKTVRPGAGWWMKTPYTFDRKMGFSTYASGNIFGISKLNGNPMPDEEVSILIQPGGKAVFEFYLPHSPVSIERAKVVAEQSFDSRFNECREFWKAKLANAAQITVPEPRINEMIRAGLLHLDMVSYGKEPDGTLAPCIGVYSPIGTESSPIIQFYNSMGLSDIARRSLTFFLDKQHDDGMIQNFGGYMVETGAALWSMGEYFRYTKDKQWVKVVEPKLLKACNFLIKWREDNKKENLKGRGYGMIAGKVADPEDPFHQYMLNAYAWLGISRVAEMLREIDSEQSNRLSREANEWKQDIRISLMNNLSNSPVVPLGDGSWCPTVPPWTEAAGPRALHLIPETFVSHGTVTAPDVLLGPLYLVFCEVLKPEDPLSGMMLDYHSELFYQRNAAFSQPYYSRHNWIQLKLGLVKPFLKTWYNTFSALADRETYTFWEHLYQVSAHKTHEEGWFLMETRWMLYLEEGETLKLLPGIPRKWMEDGKQIKLNKVMSYFGPVSLEVKSNVKAGSIEASVTCNSGSKPREIIIRLPHPDGKKAVKVTGGSYNSTNETVIIQDFTGNANIKAEFAKMGNPILFILILFAFSMEGFAQPRNKDNSTDIHFVVPVKINRAAGSSQKRSNSNSGRIYNDQAILKLPGSYSESGKPTRLIYCAHGAGGGVTSDKWFLNNYALVDTLLANGYAIFDVNGGESVENMGGPMVVRSAFNAYLYIRKHYNIEKKIFVVGLSMGGLSSSNFIDRYPDVVLAQGLFSAVLDLYGQAWEHPWLPTTRKAIATAFNFDDESGNTWESEKVAGWNPMINRITIEGSDTLKYYPVPVKLWHGRGDQVVKAHFSRDFQRYILYGRGSCELHELDSADHGLSCGNPMMNHELVLYFRRFE